MQSLRAVAWNDAIRHATGKFLIAVMRTPTHPHTLTHMHLCMNVKYKHNEEIMQLLSRW